MSFKQEELENYSDLAPDFIPIHPWNKMIKGKERGKTPIHEDWTTRDYKRGQHKDWIAKGYNLGYRIRPNQIVIDMDPRNYKGEDVEQALAELLGYFDFDELLEDLLVVKTGGGGWHIYMQLPEGTDTKLLRETLEDLPGIEFKRHGRQVLAAGSRHPNGAYYTWFNPLGDYRYLPKEALEAISRPPRKDKGYTNGKGALTGTQLYDMVLSKLDPADYSSNDTWFPLLCAAHHATDGQGVEEFVEWSLQDERYSGDENTIRTRWESLWDKENSTTIGTLIRELEQNGEETANVKAVLSFANSTSLDDDLDEDESEEAAILKESKRIAAEIDISDVLHEPDVEDGVEGKALAAAERLTPQSPQEDIMRCLRLIKAADTIESAKAIELIVSKKILKQNTVNKLLKDLEAQMTEDLGVILSKKTLEITFNKGKHLTCPPNGQLWAFHKTHWKPISDEFLSKLIQTTLGSLKEKIDIKAQELALISQATKLSRIQVATLTDRVNKTDLPPSVINCKNGEIWMNDDGSHVLKPHSYRSYLTNCLNVVYDPAAECPLFMETIRGIFEDYPDCEDMIRHVSELFGYTIQPYKNIASWWLFRGPGGDGKSTLLKILDGILHDAQLMTTVKILSSGADNSNNHAMNSALGKLSIIVEELPAGYQLKDAGVKMFSENTKMEANPKGREAFPFMYAGTLIMCSNGFPSVRDISHGMFRRANVIPFNKQFTKTGKEDIDRANKILKSPKEMAGILNWMLSGLQRLRDRGRFQEPESCAIAKKEWMGIANNVVRFVNERIEKSENVSTVVADFNTLYGVIYSDWCDSNEIEHKYRKSKSAFKQDLVSLGFKVEYGGKNVLKVYGGTLLEVEGAGRCDDFEGFEEDDL